MRWSKPRSGDIRVRTFFAWLPWDIDGDVRWLETVRVKQKYHGDSVDGRWYTVEFLPDDDKPASPYAYEELQ